MMRLSLPACSYAELLNVCIAGVGKNNPLLNRFADSRKELLDAGQRYTKLANTGSLFQITPVAETGIPDLNLLGSLSKADLVRLYKQYLVAKSKPARRIYEDLINAAKDKCPFCGGIGNPKTLDHFLPKDHFPQYSILPDNLIPSCRDCNMGEKAENFATRAEDQYIHPYRDLETFFVDQWIYAKYRHGQDREPGQFDYFVDAPRGASSLDESRVRRHFDDFKIALRYSIKAGELLPTVLAQIESLRAKGLGDDDITECILQPGFDNAPFMNHWLKGMYWALIHDLSVG